MLSQEQTLKLIEHTLEDMKAQNIIQINVSEKTSIADYMIICTGRATRHVLAIADELFAKLKAAGLDYLRITGTENGEWALLDCGDIIVHIMLPETRSFYNLEEIWLGTTPNTENA